MKQWMLRFSMMAPLLVIIGCGEARSDPAVEPSPSPSAKPSSSHFDPTKAGTVHGQVTWAGELPVVSPFEIRNLVNATNPARPRLIRDNPHKPAIDPQTKAIAGAVVFLRKVDPKTARPWDHPPVTVEYHDRKQSIVQGEYRGQSGFVRQGDTVPMLSREQVMNAVHAEGAAFFTLMFPDADKPLTRVFNGQGIVEVSSGAGYYWMRGYLFVSDHPYFARTDATGSFELHQVPPGRYQVVCWMPNWNRKSQDRDPETGLVTRIQFHPPTELVRDILIDAKAEALVNFTLSSEMFKR